MLREVARNLAPRRAERMAGSSGRSTSGFAGVYGRKDAKGRMRYHVESSRRDGRKWIGTYHSAREGAIAYANYLKDPSRWAKVGRRVTIALSLPEFVASLSRRGCAAATAMSRRPFSNFATDQDGLEIPYVKSSLKTCLIILKQHLISHLGLGYDVTKLKYVEEARELVRHTLGTDNAHDGE